MPLYVGVNGVARKAKKLYVGVDDVARKIKRAYVGVGGVARLFFTATLNQVVYSGQIEDLSVGRIEMGVASMLDYALFIGGKIERPSPSVTAAVDAYNMTLTRSTAPSLAVPMTGVSAVGAEDCVFLAGGKGLNIPPLYDSVSVYNAALTMTSASPLSVARYNSCAGKAGEYVFFAGGSLTGINETDAVDAYNIHTLTKSSVSVLPTAITDIAVGNVDGHAIFAGGGYFHNSGIPSCSSMCVAYSETLGRRILDDLSAKKQHVCALSFPEQAMFVCGFEWISTGSSSSSRPSDYSASDVYSNNLTKTIGPGTSANAGPQGLATNNSTVGIIMTGINSFDPFSALFVRASTISIPGGLPFNYFDAAINIDDYFLFASDAYASAEYSSRVDYFSIE